MSLGSLRDRTRESFALQNKCDKNLTAEEQFRKQREKQLAEFPQTLRGQSVRLGNALETRRAALEVGPFIF